jgi:hypothetical protein
MNQKKTILIPVFLFFSLLLMAQPDPTPDVGILTANNINAQVNANGALFWDFSEGAFQTASDDQLISTLRASGLWMSGLDSGGTLSTAVQLYNEDERKDYLPGAVNPLTSEPIQVNKVWRVTREDILEHLEDIQNNDFSTPVASVFAWPGASNPYFEEYNGFEYPFSPFSAAGFWDANGDAVYDPMGGDYPLLEVRGCDEVVIPSEMVWFSYHDLVTHTESQGNPLFIEVQALAFSFACADNELLNNTIFVRHKSIFRRSESLDSLIMSVFIDFDIGCPEDDYIGTIPELNTCFAYNASNMDANCGDFAGFGENPPAQSMTLLRGPFDFLIDSVEEAGVKSMGHFSYSPNGPMGAPELASQYYSLMNGFWPDGTPFPNNGFVFPDPPMLVGGNSEIEQLSTPGDRRMIASYEPILLVPGAVNEVITAYTLHSGGSNLENVQSIYDQTPELINIFDNCFSDACSFVVDTEEIPNLDEQIAIFPNPATDQVRISAPETIESLRLVDQLGRHLRDLRPQLSEATLDVSQVAAGVYYVQIEMEAGVAVKKLVVQ